MQTSYRVPLVELKSIPAGSNQSQTYIHLLGLAMRGNCEPEAVDISALPTTMIRLPPAAKAQLDAVAHRLAWTTRLHSLVCAPPAQKSCENKCTSMLVLKSSLRQTCHLRSHPNPTTSVGTTS